MLFILLSKTQYFYNLKIRIYYENIPVKSSIYFSLQNINNFNNKEFLCKLAEINSGKSNVSEDIKNMEL